MNQYQPYYLAYCRTMDTAPEKMPVGIAANIRYLKWIQTQWRAFYAEFPGCFHPESKPNDLRVTEAGREAFEVWLDGRVDELRERFAKFTPGRKGLEPLSGLVGR